MPYNYFREIFVFFNIAATSSGIFNGQDSFCDRASHLK